MEGTSTSTSRIHASDLNGPIDSSAVPADDVHEDRRERRASPSYDAAAAQGRQQSNGNSNWRRLTPERPLGRHDDGHSQGRSERQYDSRPQRSNYGGNRAAGGNADFFARWVFTIRIVHLLIR